ncbi:hypothetical protein GmHk_04G010496 [Glycine max]|nr:hypothetical protein GmHk_04G010496 [Glycine max]
MAIAPKETSAPGPSSVPSSPSSTKAPSHQERPEFNIQPIQMIPGSAPVPEKLVPKRQQGVKISENPSLATSPREVDTEMDKKIRSIVSNILKNVSVPDADEDVPTSFTPNVSVPDADKDVPTSSTPNAEDLPSPSEEESIEEDDQATEKTPAPRAPEPAPGDLIDLEDVESDEEPIANKLAPGIAERLQSRKGKLSAGKLSVKYAILHRIGAANWVPTNHTSTVATGLGKFLYAVGTKSKFNFGNYIFDQTVKHSESFAVKLPIAFPTVLCGIMLSQHPNILNNIDSVMKRESALSLHYKLFEGTHVPDIVSTSGKAAASGAVSKDALIAELKDTCKVLEATIKATTEKKMELERLIERLTESGIDDGEAAEEEEEAAEEEEDAAEDTESDDDDSEATP